MNETVRDSLVAVVTGLILVAAIEYYGYNTNIFEAMILYLLTFIQVRLTSVLKKLEDK